MLDLRAPSSWIEVELRLEPEDTRARSIPPADPVLLGAMGVGEPLVRRVEEHDLDGGAIAFWRGASRDYDFHLVELACSLRPPEGAPFATAWLKVRLDSPGDRKPIAWSMAPLRTTRAWTRSRSIDLRAQLELVEAGVTVGKEEEVHVPVVEALNLRQSDPMWEMTSSSAEPLSGIRLFAMIVRSPRGLEARGKVELKAAVSRWRFRRYLAVWPQGASTSFGLR